MLALSWNDRVGFSALCAIHKSQGKNQTHNKSISKPPTLRPDRIGSHRRSKSLKSY